MLYWKPQHCKARFWVLFLLWTHKDQHLNLMKMDYRSHIVASVLNFCWTFRSFASIGPLTQYEISYVLLCSFPKPSGSWSTPLSPVMSMAPVGLSSTCIKSQLGSESFWQEWILTIFIPNLFGDFIFRVITACLFFLHLQNKDEIACFTPCRKGKPCRECLSNYQATVSQTSISSYQFQGLLKTSKHLIY